MLLSLVFASTIFSKERMNGQYLKGLPSNFESWILGVCMLSTIVCCWRRDSSKTSLNASVRLVVESETLDMPSERCDIFSVAVVDVVWFSCRVCNL